MMIKHSHSAATFSIMVQKRSGSNNLKYFGKAILDLTQTLSDLQEQGLQHEKRIFSYCAWTKIDVMASCS